MTDWRVWVLRHKEVLLPVADAPCWAVALVAGSLLRFDFAAGPAFRWGLAVLVPLAVCLQILLGKALGLYRPRRWRYASFEEVAGLSACCGLVTTFLVAVDLAVHGPRLVPLGAVAGGGVGAFVLVGATRYVGRAVRDRSRRPRVLGSVRLLVFGAGNAGAQILSALLGDPDSPYTPVGLLDDDPSKRNLRIMGVRVLGDRRSMAQVAYEQGARALLIAVPSAGAELVAELNDTAQGLGLDVKVLPPVAQIIGARIGPRDMRDVSLEDLLGRRPADTDLESIAHYITGKRVLVTGAGGSIGSELCRQIHRFAPQSLVMLDRDESGLHGVQLSVEGRALLDSSSLVLADLREWDSVEAVFADHRPHVVFHSAALKHLTLLERHPAEALKTNVFGTLHVLEAAAKWGVERFVNVSTDKAADPTSVLGYSKRMGERLTAATGTRAPGVYLSVRFGNVLGSRGSVLESLRAQLAAGGPLTVTDPRVTRYFMTIPEAVQLMIQAGAIGRGGETVVLDMGEPICIDDMARRLAAGTRRPVEIVYTGLRPGEKLHEQLFGAAEVDSRPVHPLISHVAVPPLDPCCLAGLEGCADGAELIEAMRALCESDLGADDEGDAARSVLTRGDLVAP